MTSDPPSKASAGRTVCTACRCFLCVVVASLLIVLVLSIAFVGLRIPRGAPPATLIEGLSVVYSNAVVPILVLFGDVVRSLSPWGIIFIIALCTFLWGPLWVRQAVTSAKWEIGAVKFDPTGRQAAFLNELGEVERVVDNANREIHDAYLAARSFASQLRDAHDIQTLVGKVALRVSEIIGPTCPDDFRLTLYVPDFVFSDRLYQFTEYYDKKGSRATDGRAGRTFSVRYGIIGRVWRSGVHEIEGELISEEDKRQLPSPHTADDIIRFIARRWGLGLDEAKRVSQYNSYGAIRLDSVEKKLGIVYFDSKSKEVFGDRDHMGGIRKALIEALNDSPLIDSLLEITNETAPWSGRIQIYRNS
jgi:hypothetical protein